MTATRRINITVRAIYQNRLLASGSITGVDQKEGKRFVAQMLESSAVAVLTMDNELRGNTRFDVSVEVEDYRTA